MNINWGDVWHKYNWLVVLVLAVYGSYKTFAPPEVKILNTERTVIDRTTETSLRSQIATLKQKIKNFSREIKEDEVLTETRYPDGRIDRRIEKRTTTTDHSLILEDATTTNNNLVMTNTNETTNKTGTQTTVQNPMPLWTTMLGLQWKQQEILLGQGMNIGKNWTGMVIGSYNLKEGIKTEDRFDVGVQFLLKY